MPLRVLILQVWHLDVREYADGQYFVSKLLPLLVFDLEAEVVLVTHRRAAVVVIRRCQLGVGQVTVSRLFSPLVAHYAETT